MVTPGDVYTVCRLYAHDTWIGTPYDAQGRGGWRVHKTFDELLAPLGDWLKGYIGPIGVDYTRHRFTKFALALAIDLGYTGFIAKAKGLGMHPLHALRMELGC
jgi:hypothetical protein